MKSTVKIIKYNGLGILILLILIVSGLTVYYYLNYQSPPPLSEQVEYEFGNSSASEPADPGFVLIPVPRNTELSGEAYTLPPEIRFSSVAGKREMISRIIEQHLNLQVSTIGPVSVRFTSDNNIPPQGYRLNISSDGIHIDYPDDEGLFYSLVTLGQVIAQTDGQLPGMSITDWPDMEVRGAMLDISRDKVPSLETLYGIVDFLSMMKYNHLQLYVEGFSIEYPSFRELWEATETPVTGEEIRQLDQYCAERFIDLVPNQNSLGHMNAWLATDQFGDLAECPDGYKLLGLIEFKSTLDVSDPRSMELVKQMTDDILPYFSSGYFNANLDEPFELGKCKNRELAGEVGVGKLYVDFVTELNNYISSKGRKMMMWGDIVTKHPEIIPQIPGDVVLLEWGYEHMHPYETNCRRYDEAGLNYMVCPGTSSWTTITGRTENMKGNIANAVGNGIKYNAKGMLLTDWGDMGHWQYWPVSYAPFVYGAALSWNYESRDDLPLATFLNRMVFRDSAGIMGDLVLDMGRYNQFEEFMMVNMTTTNMAYMFGIRDKVMIDAIFKKLQEDLFDLAGYNDELTKPLKEMFDNPGPYDYRSVIDYTATLGNMLAETNMKRPDASLIIDEYLNAVRMIHLGARTKEYIIYKRERSAAENIETLEQMQKLCETVIEEHQRLWLARNKEGGLERSLSSFRDLDSQIESQMDLMTGNGVSRFLRMTGEKIAAAAAAVYIGFQ
ncbi:MAG: family 20 glycosylhydrolase [Bacteroidales bacterium]